MKYLVAESLSGTYLAIILSSADSVVGAGSVVGEFKDEETAVGFCKTWSGVA